AGHTTSYGYDSIGRITGITYPGGDEVAWLSKTFAYDFVTSDERGVSANHWRRTTTTGNAVGVTYFDAMLRPVLSDSAIGASV
ncbi:type IV secretion protein Rhs, partial [Pseudoxanthomonas sp. KAs_5_3]